MSETSQKKRAAKTSSLPKVEFKRLAATVEVTEFVDYRLYLEAVYKVLKESQPHYSYLQYAEDLGFPKSNMVWQIIADKRGLTPRACRKVTDAFGLTGVARRYFIALRNHNHARKPEERSHYFEEMLNLQRAKLEENPSGQTLEYFAEWYHPVIRELVARPDFDGDPHWIVSKLNFRLLPKEARESLTLLQRLDLVRFNKATGRWEQTVHQVMPDRKVGKVAGVRYHQQLCDMARESITRVPNERRDLNGMTICVPEDKADALKEILRKACEDIMRLEQESKGGEQVYQVNIQLFPYTKD